MMKIISDLKLYNKNSKFPIGILNIIFYANVIFRASNFFYSIGLFPIAKILWAINRLVFSIDIDPKAQIGDGFMIKHGLGLVIGNHAVIGKNFTVYQGVTIGGNSGKTRQYGVELLKQPLIGNNVVVSPNSVIIGPIIIGDNCHVGACSLVSRDIAAGSTVVEYNKILSNRL